MKGMALEWGIEGPILSPTYNLYFQYSGKTRNLVHLDAYRLQGEEDANNLLIEEFLTEPWCLAIEWPSKAACLITPQCWNLTIECTGEESRRFSIRIPEAQSSDGEFSCLTDSCFRNLNVHSLRQKPLIQTPPQ